MNRGSAASTSGRGPSQEPRSMNPLTKSNERIYSAQQLVQAMKSGIAAVKDQLQVLTILDGTAMSWPGVNQAVDDLEFLTDMAAQTTTRMENEGRTMEAQIKEANVEIATLKETITLANHKREETEKGSSEKVEELQKEISQLNKELKQANAKLASSNADVQQQKQELWTLEKQRADLATECEKYKQDNDFMEGEISSMRSNLAEQSQQITTLKEELAARKADAIHLKQHAAEQKAQVDHLKKQLDSTTAQLQTVHNSLEAVRSDKLHYEREADRLGAEYARVADELNKASKEVARLKEWQDVLKKVEADKLREEQDQHTKEKISFTEQKAQLENTIAKLTAELSNHTERLHSKHSQTESLQKQQNLLNLQIKDLQKQVTTLAAEKAALTKMHDESRAAAAQLQKHLQAHAMKMVNSDKERALAESHAREEAAAERARLTAAVEESKKESAVQKALAEGWSRDLRELQERCKGDQERLANLQNKLDGLLKDSEFGRHESSRSAATVEQVIKALRDKLEAKEAELKRVKFEAASYQKRLETHIESLQRECNESHVEIQRLKAQDGLRLPPLVHPATLQDELLQLKRLVNSLPAAADRAAPATERKLPPAVSFKLQQPSRPALTR